jgi:hypothetical protein
MKTMKNLRRSVDQTRISLLVQLVRKVFSRKLTLMVVPHAQMRPFHFQFSFSFAFFLLVFWTGLTSWASWAVFSNVDYWRMRLNHQVLKLKVEYFAKELTKAAKSSRKCKRPTLSCANF